MLPGVGIEMRAGPDDLVSRRMKKAAGRLADAGTDAAMGAGRQVHDEHLVKGIVALFLSLEDDLLGVRRKVAFAGAGKALGDLANVLEIGSFLALPVGGGRLGNGEEGGDAPQ